MALLICSIIFIWEAKYFEDYIVHLIEKNELNISLQGHLIAPELAASDISSFASKQGISIYSINIENKLSGKNFTYRVANKIPRIRYIKNSQMYILKLDYFFSLTKIFKNLTTSLILTFFMIFLHYLYQTLQKNKNQIESYREKEQLIKKVSHDIKPALIFLNLIKPSINKNSLEAYDLALERLVLLRDSLLTGLKKEVPVKISSIKKSLEIFEIGRKGSLKIKVDFKKDLGDLSISNEVLSFLENFIQNSIEEKQENLLVSISVKRSLSKIVVLVSDNGPGFPEQTLKFIGKKQFTTKKQGNGIGLFETVQSLNRNGIEVKFKNHSSGGALAELTIKN
ncbi:MAG: sensor histidine kinase [Bdellovibrionales bacterium]